MALEVFEEPRMGRQFYWKDQADEVIAELEQRCAELERECDSYKANAARYQWLRDGNAYRPEEEVVRGGDELDALCDCESKGGDYALGECIPKKPAT